MLVFIVGLILVIIPQMYVSSTYKKYLKVKPASHLTGAEVAQAILKFNGLKDKVGIECIPGTLTDHYDPKANVVRLSEDIYHGSSISSISVAAHEVGHALQENTGYAPIKFRSAFWPLATIGDKLGMLLLFVGLLMMFLMGLFGAGKFIAIIGVLLYSATVLFQLITLPVEFNASSRAMHQLKEHGFVTAGEIALSRNVLTAAALTYVATALYAVINLAYYLFLLFGRRD